MRFPFLLVPILHATARITLLDEHKSVTSVPTFDFFEYQSNPYNVTGISCHMQLIMDPKTQLCKAVAPPTLKRNKFTQSFQQTIMYAKFPEARGCGISTISQLFIKAREMLPLLAKAGYPPSKTLVIFSDIIYEGAVGCPAVEPYTSRQISVPDSVPPSDINVALVGGQHTVQFLEALDKTKPYAFNVVQETDPWNGIFLSFGYIFFKWCSAATYIVAVIVGLGRTFKVHGMGAITMNLRNMIFWMAVLSAIGNLYSNKSLVSASYRIMRHKTYIRENLQIVGDFIYTIAYHALLYLWSALLMNIQPSRRIYILQGVTLFSALLLIASIAINFAFFNLIYTGPAIDTADEILSYILISTHFITAIAFIAFSKLLLSLITIIGVDFHLRKKSLNALPQAVAALTKLSLFGLIGSFGYIVAAIVHVVYKYTNACEPVAMLIIALITEFLFLFSDISLLFVFTGQLGKDKL